MSVKPKTMLSAPNAATAGRVLVVDDHASARESMVDILRQAGHKTEGVSSAVQALQVLDTESFDVVVTDLQMPGMSGLDFIRELQRRRHGAQVLMVTAYASVSSAVEAMRHGAFDYIEKPFAADRLENLIARALEHGSLLDQGQKLQTVAGTNEPPTMIGASQQMQALRAKIARAAPTSETILITGESGTGKDGRPRRPCHQPAGCLSLGELELPRAVGPSARERTVWS